MKVWYSVSICLLTGKVHLERGDYVEVRWSAYDDNTVEVFYREGADPDIYTVKEFIAIYGEDALPDRDEANDEGADHYYEYWASMLNLVNAWAKYQGKRKLYINNDGENTRPRMEHVIIRYYDGDVGKLLRHEHSLIAQVNRALADFKLQCSKYDVESVNIMWLGLHLLEDRNYKSLRGKCQRRMNKNRPPVPIYELL